MKTSNKITSLLFLATALVTASCTPEETVVANDLTNTTWAMAYSYEDTDDNGNPHTEYGYDTIRFETHNSGKLTHKTESPIYFEEYAIPITYTYTNETQQGTVTLLEEEHNVTLTIVCDTIDNSLTMNGTGAVFYKITQ